MLSLTWKEKQFRDPFYMHQLSEGTLRFLWLVSLLQRLNLSTITMIDEPEVSLQPEMLSLLADTMKEAAKKSQIIVATHSDRLIRFLDPDEVLVMDIDEDGSAVAHWASTMDLEKWLQEYTLDEIWRMGRMGMKITIICEGQTEKALLPYLRNFLQSRLSDRKWGQAPKSYTPVSFHVFIFFFLKGF